MHMILHTHRARTYSEDNEPFLYMDDAATQHQAIFWWIKFYVEQVLNGKYIQVAKSVTDLVQVADSKLCNRIFKQKARKAGRKYRIKRIKETVNSEEYKQKEKKRRSNRRTTKQVIGTITYQEVGQVLAGVDRWFSLEAGKEKVITGFQRKTQKNYYDLQILKHLDFWNNIKDEETDWILKFKTDRQIQSFRQEMEHEQKYRNREDIDPTTYKYSKPTQAYACECGWTSSTKAQNTISNHKDNFCPIYATYGVIPAYPPKNNNWDDYKAVLKEWDGMKERLNENKCMFKLDGRNIQFDNIDEHDQNLQYSLANWDILYDEDDQKWYCNWNMTNTPRKAVITTDLGDGFVHIILKEGEPFWMCYGIHNTHRQLPRTRAFSFKECNVRIKDLTFKGTKNIWIVP